MCAKENYGCFDYCCGRYSEVLLKVFAKLIPVEYRYLHVKVIKQWTCVVFYHLQKAFGLAKRFTYFLSKFNLQ